jgi:predicted RNA-binding Zn ribbon-like protein
LDLCNTVSWRLDPARTLERLATAPDLVDWFFAVVAPVTAASPDRGRGAGAGAEPGRSSPPRTSIQQLTEQIRAQPDAADRALHAIRELRSRTIRIIDAHLVDEPAADDDVAHVSTAWRRALTAATTPAYLPWRWTVEPSDPGRLVHVLALSVADLLHRPDPTDLRRCDGEGCGWLFLDSSRNHSRRWCDPLDCGNRARVRSYSRRHRTPSGSPAPSGRPGE